MLPKNNAVDARVVTIHILAKDGHRSGVSNGLRDFGHWERELSHFKADFLFVVTKNFHLATVFIVLTFNCKFSWIMIEVDDLL